MNIRQAAVALDRIRNDRVSDVDALASEVDSIGKWLAGQKTSKMVMKLLGEAHQLRGILERRGAA
jgi:hypothetical protein